MTMTTADSHSYVQHKALNHSQFNNSHSTPVVFASKFSSAYIVKSLTQNYFQAKYAL